MSDKNHLGFCDVLILHDSISSEALRFIAEELDLPDRSVVHCAPLNMYKDFINNEKQFPINPKIIAVGAQAQELVKDRPHEKVSYDY